MSDWRKKRYQFRLTEDDEKVFEFISQSKESDSETIRKLLRFGVQEINKVKENRKTDKILKELCDEISSIKERQDVFHQETLDVLSAGVKTNPREEEKKIVNESVEDSIESMMDSFGID